MASGPEDPRSQEWSPERRADHGGLSTREASHTPRTSPPALHHLPPGPAGHAPRRTPAASPWALPPFAAPIPEDDDPRAADRPAAADHGSDESGEPPGKQVYPPPGRNPYPRTGTAGRTPIDELADRFADRSPSLAGGAAGGTAGATGGGTGAGTGRTGHPNEAPPTGGRRRRLVNRPDKLVASGPPRNPGSPDSQGGSPPASAPPPPAPPAQEAARDIGGGNTWNPLPGEADEPTRASGPGEGAREATDGAGGGGQAGRRRRRAAGEAPRRARPYGDQGDHAAGVGGSPYGPGYIRAVWPPEAVRNAEQNLAPGTTHGTAQDTAPGPRTGTAPGAERNAAYGATQHTTQGLASEATPGTQSGVGQGTAYGATPGPAQDTAQDAAQGSERHAAQGAAGDAGRTTAQDAVPGAADDPDATTPVRRIGAPPGGRPARSAVLSGLGPPRRGRGLRGRGRHHREDPRPPRRRRGRGLLTSLLVVVVLVGAAGLGFTVVSWLNTPAPTGVRLAAGVGAAADEVFLAPPGTAGSGSSQVLNAVTAVGSTVVAVGSDTTSPVPRPLFLVSTDGGGTWELGQVTGPAGVEPRAGTAGLVIGGGGRWLAAGTDAPASVGARGAGLGLAGPSGATARGMWTSADGRSWTAVDPAKLTMFRPGDRIADLARTTGGFVAVGTTALADGGTGPAAWISPDGQNWTRIDGDALGPAGKVRGIRAVVAKGDQVVALADAGRDEGGSVALRSADGGRTWQRADKPLKEVRPEPGALAVGGEGFVLVPIRQSSGGRVTVYCSKTGGSWRDCGEIGPLGAEGSGVRVLASSAAGVAAVAETSWQEYTVFTSEDGTEWAKGAELGKIPGILRGLAITDQGTLVAGGDEPAGDVDNVPVLMTARQGERARAVPREEIAGLARSAREVARLTAAANLFVAVGAARGDAGIWTSADGTGWKTVAGEALGGPGRQALADVAHGPEGWLAVGGTMSDPAVARPLLVTSKDGRQWRQAAESDALAVPRGVFHLVPHAVAAGPEGYVIAGEQRAGAAYSPVLWFTADLRRYQRVADLPAGDEVRLYDVAATSSGFVAVGGSGAADRETGVVWVSGDGRGWTARARVVPDGARSAHLRRVLATSDGLLVVGTAVTGDGRRPFAARSTDDGRTFQFSWLPADAAATVLDLTAAGPALVAVGAHGAPGDAAAWISADGREWRRQTLEETDLAGEGTQWLGAVAALGERVVALGRSTTYTADHLTLWRTAVDR